MQVGIKDDDWYTEPKPVVGLVGASGMHKTIMEGFPGSHPLHAISMSTPGYCLPTKKAKRASYEGYEPLGLVKTNWIQKHLKLIPAVCLLLVEIDDGQVGDYFEANIESLVTSVRELPGCPQLMKFMLVLVSHDQSGSSTDQSQLQERFTRLTKRVSSLDGSKNVCFLTTTSFKTSMKKLEAQAWEMAHNVYKAMGKNVKSYKHKVSKATQQPLYVRHHFKIAFYAEMANDDASALKYYQSSYSFLKQLHFTPTGAYALEIKAVAGLLNYKICSKIMKLKGPAEAVEQFQSHLDSFQHTTGPVELPFCHDWWVSLQYLKFAGLLDSVSEKLKTQSQRYNSGFFYQTAARYAKIRKESAQRSQVMMMTTLPDPSSFSPPEYLGQPMLVPGESLKAKPSDQAIVTGAQMEEVGVNHSQIVIALLTKALETFRQEKATRMILHVASQMAIEYYQATQYLTAKQYFDRIVRTYRSDKWSSILTSLQMYALECARCLEMPKDVVLYSLELMSEAATTTAAEKVDLQQKLQELLLRESANDTWRTAQSSTESPFGAPVDVYPFDLLYCTSYFLTGSQAVHVKEVVELVVSVRCNFPLPVQFSRIDLCFENGINEDSVNPCNSYNVSLVASGQPAAMDQNGSHSENVVLYAEATQSNPGSLIRLDAPTFFSPGHTRTFRIRFKADIPTDASTPLQLPTLYFHLPSVAPTHAAQNTKCLVMKCSSRPSWSSSAVPSPSPAAFDFSADFAPMVQYTQPRTSMTSTLQHFDCLFMFELRNTKC